jgi:oligopeptide/dipeptide ABC transporter ATP-binding protein
MATAEQPMETGTPLLEVRGLDVGFPTVSGVAVVVRGVSLTVGRGEIVGLVGESGSGKSVTCRAILGLVPEPGAVLRGEILLDGKDLARSSERELRRSRGMDVAMVFQDPMSSLNPVFTVGHQIAEVLTTRRGLSRTDARARAVELLDRVGIPSPERRTKAYPHELSGGMRQRVMIALALAGAPRLLLADEPTTALDVTIQDQILFLLADIRRETGMSMILVSHDMGVIAQTCDTVAVMYAGCLVEVAPALELFARPQHPYTRALLEAIPRLDMDVARGALRPIAGQPPDMRELSGGCPFAPRCAYARAACADVTMELLPVGPDHRSACPFPTSEAPARPAPEEEPA